MKKLEIKIEDEKEINVREYMKRRLGFSTSLIAKVKVGGVFINGENVHMRATIRSGDTLTVYYPDEDSEGIGAVDIPLDIAYEDEYLLVVNKPTNMPVHPSRGNSLPTLAEAVKGYVGAPFVFRAVNRLDRDTSGLVIVAKDQLTSAVLSRTIKAGGMKKIYRAIIVGKPKDESGEISLPIERECEGGMKRCVREDGKESLTRYKILHSGEGLSLAEIEPVTGRTHQIRVHMAHIGHPLYNDFLYGERTSCGTYFLHCTSLTFEHPHTKKTLTVESEPPFGDVLP